MTDDSIDGSSTEVIEDDDWLYRCLALNHVRSDGTVNRTASIKEQPTSMVLSCGSGHSEMCLGVALAPWTEDWR